MRAYRKEKDSPSFIEDQRIALKEFDKKAIIAVIDKSGQPASVVTSAISISLSEIPGVAVTAAPDSATLATVSATAPRNIAATPATVTHHNCWSHSPSFSFSDDYKATMPLTVKRKNTVAHQKRPPTKPPTNSNEIIEISEDEDDISDLRRQIKKLRDVWHI